MKNLILLFIFLTACGSGGGGASTSAAPGNNLVQPPGGGNPPVASPFQGRQYQNATGPYVVKFCQVNLGAGAYWTCAAGPVPGSCPSLPTLVQIHADDSIAIDGGAFVASTYDGTGTFDVSGFSFDMSWSYTGGQDAWTNFLSSKGAVLTFALGCNELFYDVGAI